jgi:hypothetical protein
MWKTRTKTLVLLLLVTILFYWKILLTQQFSLLTLPEEVSQGYSWLQFSIHALREGHLPLWDPFTYGGHNFLGETQTSGLSPFNVLLALVPFNAYGVLSPQVYNWFFALLHFLGLGFMFMLAREFGLTRLSSLIAGMCFSLGGFVSRIGWPDMLQSSIWLPLVFLFLLRALRATALPRCLMNAGLVGLAMGMAVLGGRVHMVIMLGIVVITAVAFYCWQRPDHPREDRATFDLREPSAFRRPLMIVLLTAITAFGIGAIQLLPSIAYSSSALRTVGIHNAVGNEKIPYAYLSDHYALPHGIACLLIPFGFGGAGGWNEFLNPYIGVFPLLLVVVAIWNNWKNPWVRYLFFLVLAAYLYSFGPFSPLHGVLYALVPGLWIMREASRILYLASFALALLAGFGAELLFASEAPSINWAPLRRAALGFVIGGGLAIAVPAVYGRPEVNPWVSLSILLIFLTYALFRAIAAGPRSLILRLLAVGLILFDLAAFDWSSRNKIETAQSGIDHWVRLMSCRGAVRFLKTLPGPFRVQITGDQPPNIGDVFSILTSGGAGATIAVDYARLSHRLDLLNVKYRLEPASSSSPNPIYQDAAWKVYENPAAFPHAWLVHQASIEPSTIKAFDRVNDPSVDLRQTAIVDARPAEPSGTASAASDQIQFVSYGLNMLALSVQSQSGGLVILSENYDSAWHATVNGRNAKVYRADGALRGVVVPPGNSRVIFEYAPRSVLIGGVLSLLTFIGVCTALILFRRARSAEPARLTS